MKEIKLCVTNMTCNNCEKRIEKELNKINGIIDVKASYNNSNIVIKYENTIINAGYIKENIEKIGYTVGKNKNKMKENLNLTLILILLLSIYFIINSTIGFNFIPQVNNSMSYGLLFIAGLGTSIHCIAMCGGINLSQSLIKEENSNIFIKSILYNIGRIVSYTILGGFIGSLGNLVSFSGTFKGIVAIISGIFMIIMGLNMLNIHPILKKINIRIPNIVKFKLLKNNKNHTALYIGLINGLMPCGPLQSMQLYALGTGSFIDGALGMLFFGLGTMPLMIGFGLYSSFLSKKYMKKILKISSILVLLLGLIMFSRGLNLSGYQLNLIEHKENNIAIIKNDEQVVNINLKSGKYTPITVRKNIPVKFIINADSKNLNGCNNQIVIPKYNVEKKLIPGQNEIDFIPTETGTYPYTCWMGMISSRITVVD